MSNIRIKERDGFSMVELIVSIGVLLILATLTTSTIYQDFKNKKIEEAVEVATKAAYASALNELNDFDKNNDSRADVQTVINEKVGTKGNDGKNDKIDFQIILQSGIADTDFNKDNLCVQGKWKENSSFVSKVGNCDKQQKANPDPVVPENPKILDTITKMTYQCDVDTIGALPLSSVKSGMKIISSDSNGKIKEVNYKNTSMKAGVIYNITIDGKFGSLYGYNNVFKNCLISIDKFGKDSGITAINYIGGDKLVDVPNYLPGEENPTVTNLSNAFKDATIFNDSDVAKWNVSNVTSMYGMFMNAKTFNQNLRGWELNKISTSKVTNMSAMFQGASSFNSYVDYWDVSNVTNTSYMFYEATSYNKSLTPWGSKTSNITNMSYMFYGASSFNSYVSNWDMSKVTTIKGMFQKAVSFNSETLNNWKNMNSLTNTSHLFSGATKFNRPLDNWNVSKVTEMRFMFFDAKSFNRNINEWETSSLIDMFCMFNGASAFNNGATSASSEQPLNINTSNVENMAEVFNEAVSFDQDLSSWDTRKVKSMSGMFVSATKFNRSLSVWGLNLKNIGNGEVEGHRSAFNRGGMVNMFKGATSYNQHITWDSIGDNISSGDTISMENMFSGATSFNGILRLNTSKVGNMEGMFSGATSFNQSLIKAGNRWDVSKVTNMREMFSNATSFKSSLNNWDTSNVVRMESMFSGASLFNSQLGYWDTSNVVSMQNMFSGASSFNNGSDIVNNKNPLSNWNTSKVTNMQGMFSRAGSFNRDISSWNVCKVDNYSAFNTAGILSESYKPAFGKFNLSCMVLSPY